MDVIALLGSLMGLGFVSGLRLYATVLTIGLGIRLGLLQLDPGLAALNILTHPYILTAAAVVYFFEFFADKVPWVDSLWDSIHTLIRPLGAAFLGAVAIVSVDPAMEIAVFLLCGAVALSSHTVKAGTRLVVNHSPEPFTNIGLSLFEDVFSIFIIWLSLTHPIVTFLIVVIFLAVFIWLLPKVLRFIKRRAVSFYSLITGYFSRRAGAKQGSTSM